MIFDKFSLSGKVAIVTGAGRGIGKGIALCLAEAGADVVCVARTLSQIEATAAEVGSLGRKSLAISCDVQNAEMVENMVKTAVKEMGHIDILVNNAAVGSLGTTMRMNEIRFESDLRASLTSVYICSRAVAKGMLEQKSGTIVNISSRQGQIPSLGQVAYGAAKAGVNSLTKTMAWEFAPYVRVNAIAPGAIWTEEAAKGLAMIKDQIEAVTPRRRVGTVEDIALTVLYLASPASDFVTGKLLEVDGGIEFSAPVATQGWGPNKTPKSKA